MKSTRLWLGCLALAGSCLVAPGCGGGDVPDPTSDSSAAPQAATPVVDRAAAVAATPEQPAPEQPAPEPPAAEAPRPEVAATPAPAPAPAAVVASEPGRPEATPTEVARPEASATAPTPAEEAKPAATPTADSAATDEMMRIGATSNSTPPAETAAAAPSGSPAPSGAPAPAVAPMAAAGPMPGAGPPPVGGQATLPSPEQGGAGAANAGGGAGSLPTPGAGGLAFEGGAAPMGGPGAGMSVGGAGGSAGAPIGPDTFRNPVNATRAFLDALKSKNKDRLSEVTARRSATEAVEKHRKVFAAILDGSISDEELDDLAKALDGFQVMSMLPAKSTGMIGVLIGKMDHRDRLQRTVSVRKEKEGWKVMDVGGTIDFKPVGTMRPTYGRKK